MLNMSRPRRRLAYFGAITTSTLMMVPLGAVGPDPTSLATGPARSTEVVILTGQSFPTWSAGPEVAVREPQPSNLSSFSDCRSGQPEGYEDGKDHNCNQAPRYRLKGVKPGTPVNKILGYRWNGGGFEQIPFQIDEKFTRYLTNNNSGFAFYSGADKHITYAFDREGWRYTTHTTTEDPMSPCLAKARGGVGSIPDPIQGLDDNDELVFMYTDAGEQAPPGAALPTGISELREVAITDPFNGSVRYAYAMLAADGGPVPAFDESNGHVRYERDADADLYLYSQSSYRNYGAAPEGPYFDPATGTCVTATPKQRRPKDTATITTSTYKFRYDGRWLMTGMKIRTADGGYGPDLVDQWKARAFQQRPGGQTPCCGYEEEVNNWGGSSILLGELSGPVRAIRETWGADSATNNIRREVFYRDEVRQQNYLRVHVIPPGDGIYVQWDYNAGIMDTYSNPFVPAGVPVDGKHDEVFGNLYGHVGADGVEVRDSSRLKAGDTEVAIGARFGEPKDDGTCNSTMPRNPLDPDEPLAECVYNDFDVQDPTFSGPHGALNWEQISGPHGTLVTRWTKLEVNAGNGYQATTFPYYRDDSCFDDGTGSDPGPHLNPRKPDSGSFGLYNGEPRRCWTPADGIPTGTDSDRQWWQGDIGTHGLHVNLIADSDNAMLTESVTEITSEYRMVALTGRRDGSAGEAFGRAVDKPLITTVT